MDVDPEILIRQAPVGTAIYARVQRPEPYIDFLVREESRVIDKLQNPVVQLSAGLFVQDKVALVVVMFWIGTSPEQLFETWWNYYQTGEGEKYFDDFARQEHFAIHLYESPEAG